MTPRTLEFNWRVRLLVASGLLALQIPLSAFPRATGYVNDFASVLDENAETYLETFLQTVERDTSAEIVVVTVESLDGMSVEEYANRLFAAWGIGKEQRDNGVLVLVAPKSRMVRIEVGYGLESILPDGLAGEIIRTEMIPEFKSGNYPRGIGRGLNRIARIARHEAAAVASPAPEPASDLPLAIVTIPLFGLFIVLGAFVAGLGIRTKTYGPVLWGALFGGIPLLLATTNSVVLSLAVLVPIGLVGLIIGFKTGRTAYWRGMLRRGNPESVGDDQPSAWVMGGTSGSSTDASSHDSGSSSSPSFGGGSSGGGGASGRW